MKCVLNIICRCSACNFGKKILTVVKRVGSQNLKFAGIINTNQLVSKYLKPRDPTGFSRNKLLKYCKVSFSLKLKYIPTDKKNTSFLKRTV